MRRHPAGCRAVPGPSAAVCKRSAAGLAVGDHDHLPDSNEAAEALDQRMIETVDEPAGAEGDLEYLPV
jgi:hypothetical protein